MSDKTKSLLCKQCGYANEGERVYCHNCGTKLDRSLLPESSATVESLAKKRKRIRKIVTPRSGFFIGAGKTFCYTMLSSAVVAALILIALPPDDVPAAAGGDDLLNARPISMDLETAIESRKPENLTLPQAEINTYLLSKVTGAASGFLEDEVKFARVFVNLDEDRIRVTNEQKVFGYSVYSSIYYKLAIKGNKLDATVKGGNFGRLQVHPNLMNGLGSLFQKIWETEELRRDKKLLDGCQSIEVHKDHVDVVTQPAQ